MRSVPVVAIREAARQRTRTEDDPLALPSIFDRIDPKGSYWALKGLSDACGHNQHLAVAAAQQAVVNMKLAYRCEDFSGACARLDLKEHFRASSVRKEIRSILPYPIVRMRLFPSRKLSRQGALNGAVAAIADLCISSADLEGADGFRSETSLPFLCLAEVGKRFPVSQLERTCLRTSCNECADALLNG